MSTVLIVMIVFGFVAFIVKMGLDHDRSTRGSADNSVTTSELRRLITESVDDATTDLRQRLDRMERRLEAGDERRALTSGQDNDDPTTSSENWRDMS